MAMKKGMKMEKGAGMKQMIITAIILVAFVGTTPLALAATLTIEPDGIIPGIPVNVTGTGFDSGEKVTVITTVTCWKPVVDDKCECTMQEFEIPENATFKLTVREVEDNVTLYLKRLGIWWTVNPDTTSFFLFEYNPNTSNVTCGKIPALFAGIYSIDVIGDAVDGAKNCTMITTAKLEVTADGDGNFTMEGVNTQGIPICNFTINATGQDSGASAEAPLNISLLGDASKDGQINAYDCCCIARYWAGISGYDNSTIAYSAADGLAPPCDQVTLDDARCLARYLVGLESSIPCSGCP